MGRLVNVLCSLSLLVVSAIATSSSQTSFEEKVRDAVQGKLDLYAQYFNTSFSLGIASAGGVKFSVVAGEDDHRGNKIRENSIVPLGSATKFYTAIAVLQLAEQGILNLDDPVYKIVDPFLQRTNKTTLLELWNNDPTINTITARQLMGMRACLSDYDDQALQKFQLDPANENVTITPYDFLHAWAPKSFVCQPGSGGSYSSIGYVVLGFLVAGAKNVTEWTDFDQRSILPENLREELSMLTFPLLGKCSDYANVSHQFAATFDQSEAPGYWTTIHWNDIYEFSCLNGWTMGNIAAASSDTAGTMYHVFGKSASTRLLSNVSLQAMQDFLPLTTGWSVGLQYGLGLMQVDLFPNKGASSEYTTFIGHAGQDYGSAATMHYYNEATDIAVTLASNTEYGMNCSLPNIYSNFQGPNYVACQVWSSVLDVATDGNVQLNCDSSELLGEHLQGKLGAALSDAPIHCASGTTCVGASSDLDPQECYAWKEFHAGSNGVSWKNGCADKWNDPCGCMSVTCSAADDGNQHIVGIDLSAAGIAGSFPDVVSKFTQLETLNISYNYFFGTLPSSIAELKHLKSFSLQSNAFSSKLPELPFAQYTDACSIVSNDWDCPLPTGADACHSGSQTPPQCDKGPALSTVCGIEAGIVFSNVELAAALNALYQALGVAAGTEAAADCGAELEKSHTCHFGLDLSDPSLAPLVANVQRAADDLSIKTRVCAIDMDKVQYCNNLGTCELFIKNVSLAVIPKACTAEDGESYLAYLGRFSQCIKSDYGTKCNYTWAGDSSCSELNYY